MTASNEVQSHINEVLYQGVIFSVDRSMEGKLDKTFGALKGNASASRKLGRKAKWEVYNVMPAP